MQCSSDDEDEIDEPVSKEVAIQAVTEMKHAALQATATYSTLAMEKICEICEIYEICERTLYFEQQ